MLEPSLTQVIASAIDDKLIDVHTALPGVVQSYDKATQTAEIELQVRRALQTENGEYTTEELPILPNVPVIFARTSQFYISLPVKTGDSGIVIFNEAIIDQWRSLGKSASPTDIGRHTLAAGVFLPGLFPAAGAIAPAPPDDGVRVAWVKGAHVTVYDDGRIEAVNGKGYFKLTASGQFDANGNFTVDP